VFLEEEADVDPTLAYDLPEHDEALPAISSDRVVERRGSRTLRNRRTDGGVGVAGPGAIVRTRLATNPKPEDREP
jgi:hypothetical protein